MIAPEHGNMTGDSFTFKDTVEFGCDEGYLLTGSFVRECLNTGDWDGTPAECKRMYHSIILKYFITEFSIFVSKWTAL